MKIIKSQFFANFFGIALFLFLAGTATADQPAIRVGSEVEFPPFAFIDERGQAAGFSVDLIKAVADEMGLPIVITTGKWDEVWDSLVEGRLDVLPVVAKSSERQRLVDFSQPHTETFDAFFVRDARPKIQNLAAAQGKEIVVMRSDAAHHALLEQKFQGTIVTVDTIPEGLSLIASGKHDAFLCSKLIGVLTIQNHDIKGLTAGPPIPDYKRVFAFGVKKGDDELREKLNQGLLIVKSNGEYDRIYEKWLGSVLKINKINLTDEEKAWIEKHPFVNLGFTTTFPPFSFIGENNEPSGMALDYLEILRKSTGIDFKITETGINEKIYPLLKAKQFDGLPYSVKTLEREQYLNFTKPYMITNWIVVTRNDHPFIESIEYLKGKKVGVIRRSAAWEFLHNQQGIEVIKTDSQKDLWESLSFGKTDAVVQNIETAGYFISKIGITNLKVAYTFPKKVEVGLSIRKDMPELVNILNKAIDSITTEEHAEIRKKWMSLRYEQGLDWRTVRRWIVFISLIFLSILITTLFWNRRLAREVVERKRAEELLRASEQRHRIIIQTAMDGFWMVDMQGRLLQVNEAYCRMSGYSEQELLTMRISDLEAVENSSDVAEHIEKIMSQGEDRFESRHRRKDGSVFDIEVSAKFQPTEGGWFIGFNRDITQHRQAEKALKESEKQFRRMFENHHAIMLLVDPESGKIIRANLAAQKYYGYTAEEFETLTIYQMNQLNKEEIAAEMAKAKTEKRNYFHFPHLLASGEIRDVEVHSSPIPFKGKTILFSIVHDITERRLAEAALRESEERYRKAQSMGHVGNWEYNIQTNRFWGSDEAKRIYGFDVNAGDFTTDEVENCIPERERVHQALVDLIEKDKEYRLEFDIITKDTKERKTIISIAGLERDENGRPLKITGVIQDITNRKRAEDALRVSLEKYRVLFQSFPVGVSVMDDNGNLIEANRESERLLGVSATKHNMRKIDSREWKIIRPDGTPMPSDEYAGVRALKTKQLVENIEMGIIKENQDITWINVHASPIPIEGYGVVVAYNDITARKLAEDALRESEGKFYKAFHSSPVVMSITSLDDGTFIDVNSQFTKITEFSREEVIGLKAVELGIWRGSERTEIIREIEKSGFVHSKEIQLNTKSGRAVPLL